MTFSNPGSRGPSRQDGDAVYIAGGECRITVNVGITASVLGNRNWH